MINLPTLFIQDPETDRLYKKIIEGKFTIPGFVSDQARDLIKKILNTDPSKRLNIQQIQLHPWFNLNNTTVINCGIRIKKMEIPVI